MIETVKVLYFVPKCAILPVTEVVKNEIKKLIFVAASHSLADTSRRK